MRIPIILYYFRSVRHILLRLPRGIRQIITTPLNQIQQLLSFTPTGILVLENTSNLILVISTVNNHWKSNLATLVHSRLDVQLQQANMKHRVEFSIQLR